jgi:cytochrome c
MHTYKQLTMCIAAASLVYGCAAQFRPETVSQSPALGPLASAEEIAGWDLSIPPSGAGLPTGSGTVGQGAAVYAAKCQACHGEKGSGKPADALAGGIGSLSSSNPVRTVGSYWPYATTLFDFVRRAMPTIAPLSLTNDEVYAVSAYILNLNGIVPADAVMDARTLPQVRMPNRDGFIDYSRK